MSRAMDFGGKITTRRDEMMDNFDPNAPDENEWASFIPRWRGSFHTHKERGRALRALNPRFAASGILYRKVDGRWVEVHRHDIRDVAPSHCELCGKPKGASSWSADALVRGWLKERGKVVDPPCIAWMCWPCATHR